MPRDGAIIVLHCIPYPNPNPNTDLTKPKPESYSVRAAWEENPKRFEGFGGPDGDRSRGWVIRTATEEVISARSRRDLGEIAIAVGGG